MSASPDATDRALCPFCRKPVEEDLLRFGGNCPHCLIEIPGEEAPTDPGAELRAAQQAAERRELARRRTMRLVAGLSLFLLVAGGGAAWVLTRPEPAPPVEPQRFEFDIVSIANHQDPDYEGLLPEQQPEPKPAARKPATRSSRRATGGTAAAVARAAEPESSIGQPPPVEVPDGPLEAFTVPVALGDRGPKAMVLSDPDKISEMVGHVLARGQPQITRCYEQRLNARPKLSGTWLVDFTITKEGKATDIAVQALDEGDRELEACIRRAVSRWTFMRVAEPVPSGTKYRFSPRG